MQWLDWLMLCRVLIAAWQTRTFTRWAASDAELPVMRSCVWCGAACVCASQLLRLWPAMSHSLSSAFLKPAETPNALRNTNARVFPGMRCTDMCNGPEDSLGWCNCIFRARWIHTGWTYPGEQDDSKHLCETSGKVALCEQGFRWQFVFKIYLLSFLKIMCYTVK